MKFIRSTKCSLKFTNHGKQNQLLLIMTEYCRVVNEFIKSFWNKTIENKDLLKPIVDSVESWFSARLRKVAAREAIAMISAAKAAAKELAKDPVMPVHHGLSMSLSSTIGKLIPSNDKEFDYWLKLTSIGNNIKIMIPIKRHKHFNELALSGRLMASYVIHADYVQFAFKFKTEPKIQFGDCIGLDSGIKALATLDSGESFGKETEQYIARINRKKHGSKGQKRARRAFRQYIDEVAKKIVSLPIRLLVVEKLKGLNNKSRQRRRLCKSMRRVIGAWAYRYWLRRLQSGSERKCFSFRTVAPFYTSTTCSACGYSDKRNRAGEVFSCIECNHRENADQNAAKNILRRFLTGPYGAGFKSDSVAEYIF